MSEYKILIPEDITDKGKEYLRRKGYIVDSYEELKKEEIIRIIGEYDGLLARTRIYDKEILEAADKLKVISRYGVGIDNIDIEYASKKKIQITNAPLANYNSVAEHTVALILACTSNLVYLDKEVRKGNWYKRNIDINTELTGKTLGLIGAGRIGREVGRKMKLAFNMNIVAYDPFLKQSDLEDIKLYESIDEILELSDIVSLHLPLTEDTRQSVNKDFFEKMKSTSYLINCARGEVLNEEDLFIALKNNWIKGAGLDVLNEEPPKIDNPLFQTNKVIISPHNGALTQEAMDRMGIHAAMGIDDVLNGRQAEWRVNTI